MSIGKKCYPLSASYVRETRIVIEIVVIIIAAVVIGSVTIVYVALE